MIEDVRTLTAPPEIGRYYLVPAVFGEWDSNSARWWPVMGPLHEDVEIVGFDTRHYHIDPRFLAENIWRRSLWGNEFRAAWHVGGDSIRVGGSPVQFAPDDFRHLYGTEMMQPAMMRMLCKRVMPDRSWMILQGSRTASGWGAKMEGAYADAKLKPGMICPHRGAPLASCPVGPDRTVVCPLHGLRWHVDTGEMIPQRRPVQEDAA